MAEKKDKSKKFKPGSKETEAFIEKAMKQLKRCVDADDHNRKAGIEDLRFLNGEQWDPNEKKRRADAGRPALTINLLPKFVDQVCGDERENRPSIKIRPVDNKADVAIAKIREGIIRNIEYCSNAPMIYDQAFEMMISCGFGAWRILTRYTEENPFIQEIYLEAIKNPFLVYLDPDCKNQISSDATFGFVLEKLAKDAFLEKYPGAKVPTSELKFGKGVANENWYDKDTVTVAEYFVLEKEEVKMHLLDDGTAVDDDEYRRMIEEYEESIKDAVTAIETLPVPEMQPMGPQMGPQGPPKPSVAPGGGPIIGGPPAGIQPPVQAPMAGAPPAGPAGQMPQPGQAAGPNPQQPPQPPQLPDVYIPRKQAPKIEKTRVVEKTIVSQYTMTCCEVLDGPNRVAGKYIPLIMVYGKERNIEGKRYIRSLIRDGIDPQKMVNYWNTSAAETIALQPKTPWVGTAKQFEGYEADYAAANVQNFPFLKYNADPDAQGPPQRNPPGQPPVALFEQIRRGEDNIKSVLGMFNSDLGDNGPERSGVAITQRQKPGDIGTYAFLDNLARAVVHSGKIINEMIPTIYDTERDVRLRHYDDTESWVPVNTTAGAALKLVKEHPERYVGLNIKKIEEAIRKYGKDTKFNEMTMGKYDVIVSTGPSYASARQEASHNLLQLVQAMPQQMAIGADLIVKNMDFKDAEELSERLRKTLPPHLVKLREGEEPPKPPQPPPQVQIQMIKLQIEQGKLNLQQLKIQQENAKLEHSKLKVQLEMAKNGQAGPEGPNQAEIMEKMERLKLERQRLELEMQKFMKQMDLDTMRLEHQIELENDRLAHQSNYDYDRLEQERKKHEDDTEIRRKEVQSRNAKQKR